MTTKVLNCQYGHGLTGHGQINLKSVFILHGTDFKYLRSELFYWSVHRIINALGLLQILQETRIVHTFH